MKNLFNKLFDFVAAIYYQTYKYKWTSITQGCPDMLGKPIIIIKGRKPYIVTYMRWGIWNIVGTNRYINQSDISVWRLM